MATFSPQSLPIGINAPTGANFRKQYLPTSVFRDRQDTLFFLRSLAQNLTESEILEARETLGIKDETTLADQYVAIPIVEQPAYNGFFVEMDIQRPATIRTTNDANGDAADTDTVSGGVPVDVTVRFQDVSYIKPRMTILDTTTLGVYQIQSIGGANANNVVLRLVVGGTYSNTGNFPPTFTNGSTGLAIAQNQEFLIMAGNVEHGASTAIENEPSGVAVRQFRIQTDYEKFVKSYQGLKEEGSQLIRELDFDRRLQQIMYDVMERHERSIHYNKGDDVTIAGNNFLYTDGLLDTIGTTIAAGSLGSGATTPDLDTIDDIIFNLRQTGGLNDYCLCVGNNMAKVISSLSRTETNYRVVKNDEDTRIGQSFNEVVGTFGGVDVVYNPQLDYTTTYAQSIVAFKKSNVILSTVSNSASVDLYNRSKIEGEGIIKMKRDIQSNEELNVGDAVLVELGATLVHPETHYAFTGFTGVS